MIEDKIDKLIAAIETLTETLSKGVKAEDTKKEVPAEEPAENVTLDQLQDLCLKNGKKRSQKQGENHQNHCRSGRGIAKRY